MILINKRAVAAKFGRAAQSYSSYNELQRRSAQGLLTLLAERDFSTVLDAGCGPGGNSLFWRESGSRVTALDLSLSMLEQARMKKAADAYLVADIEAIPLIDAQFDLVWSHLAVQWCTSLQQALAELYRVTRPGGRVAFTTLLTHSLSELSRAWEIIDTQPHTNSFLSFEEVEKTLCSWRVYRYEEETVTLYFNDALSAMRSLKGIGATYLHTRSFPSRVLTRHQLQKLEFAWPKKRERCSLTYQLFHGVIERD